MAAAMSFVSTNGGTYTFGDIPLVNRAVAYNRIHDSVRVDRRRINVVLSGFFTGDTHDEIMTQYQALKAVLADSNVVWNYNDGVTQLASGQVYIQAYTEPSDWKQYDGTYTINFYYFEKHTENEAFNCSFVNGAGTLTLSPVPAWSRSIRPISGTTKSTISHSGATIGSEASITLTGTITDTNLSADGPATSSESALLALQTNFETILLNPAASKTGTLNYGSFSEQVYVDTFDFGQGTLQNSFDYTIGFKYWTQAIMNLSTKVGFTRIHNNPKITERPHCGNRRITYGNVSGQEVNYNIKLWADTISNARSLLATELAALVLAGGIEMPGGVENWDYDTNSVAVTIKHYHDSAVLANIV